MVDAHQRRQLTIDDFDNLLGRRQAAHYLPAHGPFFYIGDKSFDHAIMDIGFQQGNPHFLEPLVDVFFGEFPVALELLESRLEPIA